MTDIICLSILKYSLVLLFSNSVIFMFISRVIFLNFTSQPFNQANCLMSRVFANGPGDRGSILD